LLNVGKYKEAADQFLLWNKAGGKVLKGLQIRRQKEKDLFLS
jgi:lysozyme